MCSRIEVMWVDHTLNCFSERMDHTVICETLRVDHTGYPLTNEECIVLCNLAKAY